VLIPFLYTTNPLLIIFGRRKNHLGFLVAIILVSDFPTNQKNIPDPCLGRVAAMSFPHLDIRV
jgi:hypothetical protein